ncbi:sulfotransferase [Frankia sp. CNm7]|uniref:Sulfotransferase n=1 Tax=Frankia nepalensis TaxID=1836974 RepID=A0A937RBY3_9ACTN|nr:sulfotransferase [Frankia nepalensis]MBL7496717.1 sulfotransferase [Frankia nepalensis]MBL7511053.1 sulfotransferase [Frankia nepalensis]MBL7516725.1 sulfotransferase [Frankia nepalensis]MBL7627457.1 sulfotransferase [Frankia nepalensis]
MGLQKELLDAARAETGLEDFGDDSFREGLERLTRSLETEARPNAAGRSALRKLLVGLLSQRLQIEDWYRRHPEIDDERIVAPLIGLGLPRTGSTALSFLLAEDPQARSLRMWEASAPCPPPSTGEGQDARLESSRAEVEGRTKTSPRRAALVPASATGPTECQSLMALDFKAHYFQAFAHVPSYSKWLLETADLTTTYRYELRTLKLLQWGFPARPWRLKCPAHLLFLDQLDQVFPDARFVMTHRDPAEVMVSAADLYAAVAHSFSDDVDLRYLGALNVEHWSVGMERALAFRDAGRDDRFYDIDFRAMQSQPVDEVRKLYAWLGEPVTDAFEAGMRRWWQENAEKREKNVHPDPATFGIDVDEIRPLFADYTARAARWTAH